jgi:hypothetical protein
MIRRVLALRYVCKKYDLKYCWTLFGDRGWIGFVEENNSGKYELLGVGLFSKHFWSILFHEVGHLVAKRTLNYQTKHCNAANMEYQWGIKELYTLLAEEATASKFASRMTKGKSNKFLKQCWHTYTADAKFWTREDDLDKFISTVHKYNKYFEGNTK